MRRVAIGQGAGSRFILAPICLRVLAVLLQTLRVRGNNFIKILPPARL